MRIYSPDLSGSLFLSDRVDSLIAMTPKLIVSHALAVLASAFLAYFAATQLHVRQQAALRAQHAAQESISAAEIAALQEKLHAAELQRDQYRISAAEVHKLRGEISDLRKSHDALVKRTSNAARESAAQPPAPTTAASQNIPSDFPNHTALAQFAGGLRLKSKSGQLTPEEAAWLQAIKPELDKLEANPQAFAEFQTALIQSVAGVSDPAKLEQIRQTILRVYENANNRGLHLQARPDQDPAWVEQRHQLDRRGTGAVQKLLDENERAAFDRSFLGIMGVDLGTGVDKSLYPPGFIQEERITR